jgi:hypothetical protein
MKRIFPRPVLLPLQEWQRPPNLLRMIGRSEQSNSPSTYLRASLVAVCASILAARKLASVPRNSPAYVTAIADAVADARRILEKIEQENGRGR